MTDIRNSHNPARPFDDQTNGLNGVRSSMYVNGVTIRDLCDALIRA